MIEYDKNITKIYL